MGAPHKASAKVLEEAGQKESEQTHSNVPQRYSRPFKVAEDVRNSLRTELRPGDGLKAVVLVGEQRIPLKVFDVSPIGAGFIVQSEFANQISEGKLYKFELMTTKQQDMWVRARIRWKGQLRDNFVKFGVEFQIRPGPDVVWPLTDSIEVVESAPILGVMYKPYLFYERAALRFERFSQHMWQIRIFDTEILAIPGVQFEIYMNTTGPNADPIIVEFAIVDSVSKDSVLVNIFPRVVPPAVREWIAQQLVFGSDCAPETMRKIGFEISGFANGLKFRYVKTQEDYEQVLKLRYKAYAGAGKVLPGKTHLDMAAPLDPISRIIAAYAGEKIVATVAIAYPDSEEIVLDTERPFVNGYPKAVPPKTDSIEVARLCTDPEYRRGDLLVRMLEHSYRAMRCGNRKHVITSTDDKLWPLYRKIGFRKTGMVYNHPYLAGLRHHVITISYDQVDLANRVNPLAWNYAWRDMSFHLEDTGLIRRSGLSKLKVLVLSYLGRVLGINVKKKY